MTRILLVSKFREFHGGVERHLFDLASGLASRGHDVSLFSSEDVEGTGGTIFAASAEGFAKLGSARSLLWNSSARNLIGRHIREFKPDVVHFHSIYHQLSPSVLGVFDGPTLMTLHDYKLSAPCYSLFRDGGICQECVGRRYALPAIRHKCIGDSSLGSALCALEGGIFRDRYKSMVNRFIVPSRFAFDVAVRGGVPRDRLAMIPWGVAFERRDSLPREPATAFYGGRLQRDKGVRLLLDAWATLPPGHGCILRIAGQGELEREVVTATLRDETVQYLGMLSADGVVEELQAAEVAIIPSLVPETMGLSAIEALVLGTPVIASDRGALSDLKGPGVWMLPRLDIGAVREALSTLLISGMSSTYRQALNARDLTLYSSERMVSEIEAEYEAACRKPLSGYPL